MRIICLRLLVTTTLLAAMLVIGAFGRIANEMPDVAAVAIDASR